MPVNSWDYLMGDKQTHGHNAGTYTLEDYSELVREYDRYLAPALSIGVQGNLTTQVSHSGSRPCSKSYRRKTRNLRNKS